MCMGRCKRLYKEWLDFLFLKINVEYFEDSLQKGFEMPTSHILAAAVRKLHPKVQLAIEKALIILLPIFFKIVFYTVI